jgi:hypothetical protein
MMTGSYFLVEGLCAHAMVLDFLNPLSSFQQKNTDTIDKKIAKGFEGKQQLV